MSSSHFHAFVVNKMHPNQLWLVRFFPTNTTTSRSAAVLDVGVAILVITFPNSWSCACARAPTKACILHSKLTVVKLTISNDSYNSSFLLYVPCVLEGVAVGLLDASDSILAACMNKKQVAKKQVAPTKIKQFINIMSLQAQTSWCDFSISQIQPPAEVRNGLNLAVIDPNLGHKWFGCMLTQGCEIQSTRCWQFLKQLNPLWRQGLSLANKNFEETAEAVVCVPPWPGVDMGDRHSETLCCDVTLVIPPTYTGAASSIILTVRRQAWSSQ